MYKLDGADKLRFFDDLSDPASRVERIGRLIDTLMG
jgi:transcription-repair coupling factor (superfamily II helicase)